MPYMTVVIPTHNRESLVLRAVGSVLAQAFDDFEIVVADDGSTDGTQTAVERIRDHRLRYVRQEHAGEAAARNLGVSAATSPFVTFLDSDDEALPAWLLSLASLLDSTGSSLARCGLQNVGPDGRISGVLLPGSHRSFEQWVHRFLAGTYAIDRRLVEAAGGYTESLSFGIHTEFAMRLWRLRSESDWSVATIQKPLVRRHWSGGDQRYGGERARMAEYVLDRHGPLLASHGPIRATYLAIVGVHAARSSDLGKARRYLWRAWRSWPWRPKGLARLIAASIPPFGRRVWLQEVDR